MPLKKKVNKKTKKKTRKKYEGDKDLLKRLQQVRKKIKKRRAQSIVKLLKTSLKRFGRINLKKRDGVNMNTMEFWENLQIGYQIL